MQWRISVVILVTHKGNQVHGKGAQYSGRANNSMKRNGRNGPERIIDSCDCSAQKRTNLFCLYFYRIRGKLKQTLGCTFLKTGIQLIKCIKDIVNTVEGIKYSFFEQIQDTEILK